MKSCGQHDNESDSEEGEDDSSFIVDSRVVNALSELSLKRPLCLDW